MYKNVLRRECRQELSLVVRNRLGQTQSWQNSLPLSEMPPLIMMTELMISFLPKGLMPIFFGHAQNA